MIARAVETGRQTRERLKLKLRDEARFFKSWLNQPLTTGAVTPSGPYLAKAMAAAIPEGQGPVVELGPGTGVVTKAILDHGVQPHDLTMIEYNGDFAEKLRDQFQGTHVLQGDAYALHTMMAGHLTKGEKLKAIVSSLPLFTQPKSQRLALMNAAMNLLEPGAPFIQFSYALVPPVEAITGKWSLKVSPWIVRNVPPARVWTYRAD